MNNQNNYKKMYLRSTDGISKTIEILNSKLSNEEKIALALQVLVSAGMDCENIYVEHHGSDE